MAARCPPFINAISLQLAAEPHNSSTQKILTTARLAGLVVDVQGKGGKTPVGAPVPELTVQDDLKVRHTNAVLRRIAQTNECGLMGANFFEEGQVDSWLEWTSLEVDHHVMDGAGTPERLCEVLEHRLKGRTFIVGQRLTLADISVSCSLKQAFDQAGIEKLRTAYPNTMRWFLTCAHQLGLENSEVSAPASPAKKAVVEPKTAVAVTPAVAAVKAEGSKSPATKAASPKIKAASPKMAPETVGEAGNSKKDDKKKAKEEEKRKKEEEKKRKEDERIAEAQNKHKGPDVTMFNFMDHEFGNLFIQSQCSTGRAWTTINSLKPAMKDKEVWIRARVHNSRKQGGKLCFITLRENLGTVQAVIAGPEIAGFSGALPDESVVDILGKVALPGAPITSCTVPDVELQVQKIFCIGRAVPLPLQLADAGRSDLDYEKDPSLVRVGQDVRLDNRVIDLRTVTNQAIFRIQSGVCQLFREFLLQHGMQEIHTPKTIGGSSEGGADIFHVKYFEQQACLAQSPQLYKQMALMTDMPGVFEIGPVFRAEKSFTHRHLCEFTGLDFEMTFKDHYNEVLEVLDGLFNHIFKGLNERFSNELDAVRKQHPFEPLKWKFPCKRFNFDEAVELLKAKGPAVLEAKLKKAETDYERGLILKHLESVKAKGIEEDLSTEDEKILGKVVLKEFGEELYIIDKFPKDVRPFYTMPDPKDARWANAYDVFLRGEEITSGAQRIHDPKMLTEKAEALGIPPASIQPYIDAFKYGSFPHAGAGIGMERVVMLFMNLNNIRKTSMFPRDPKRLSP